MDAEQRGLGLEQALATLRRRAPWIVLCFALVTVAAFGFSKAQTRKYTATAALVFNNQQQSQQLAGLPAAATSSPQAQQSTNLKLVQLGDMAEKTARQLGRGLTKGRVGESLSVSAQGESNIVDVSATATSPTLAAEIANTYSNQFVAEQQSANHQSYASALALVNKQLAALSPQQRLSSAGIALQDRAQSLGVLAELRSGNVQVAQPAAVPTAPSAPKTAQNTILGAILGLLLGLGIAFLVERFDRRIREPRDLEEIYGLPLLGVVPESSALARSGARTGKTSNGTTPDALPAAETEAFHLIRAHLRYFNVDRQLRTLLVASAGPGDGKTTVARHLAVAAARMDARVLLLEADLRRPTIAQQMGIKFSPGLSDVLIGATSTGDATQSIALGPVLPRGGEEKTLDVLVAGAVLPPNPAALIESHAMQDLLEQAKSVYDLVVIDTPPLTAVSDAFPLLRKVDGVVIVGWVGRNRRDVAQRLHDTLDGSGAPLLGVIANGFKPGRLGAYAYSYDYAYAESDRRASAGATANGTTWTDDGASSESSTSPADAEPAREPVTTGKR
jgi:tyrosine-protein kinase